MTLQSTGYDFFCNILYMDMEFKKHALLHSCKKKNNLAMKNKVALNVKQQPL